MVLTGLDVLSREGFARLRGLRVGLITHPAAVDAQGTSAVELFTHAPNVSLGVLFGPEHGITGEAQDLVAVAENAAQKYGPTVISLYGSTFESLKPTRDHLKELDVLVVDMQDVGSRYYTFQATMLYAIEAAAEIGLPVLVLDRPNPIGGAVEGPTIQDGFDSFVGPHPIAIRHGMTMGELAKLYVAERVPQCQLTVVPCEGWNRDMPWRWALPPSPNMPTVDTALVYPGGCLIEGTNLSEGRGTTRPFEYIGFPGVDPKTIVDMLSQHHFPGVRFLPVTFRPTFQKHAGQPCGGVFQMVTNPQDFLPVRTALALMLTFRNVLGPRFIWRTETYEFVSHIPAIDLLFGSDRVRTMIAANAGFTAIVQNWVAEEAAFRVRRKPYLIYEG